MKTQRTKLQSVCALRPLLLVSSLGLLISSLHAQEIALRLDNIDRHYGYGRSIAAMGDLDGDGVEDIGIMSTGLDIRGVRPRIYFYSGRSGALIRRIDDQVDDAILDFANAGDLNGDGVEDFLYSGHSRTSRISRVYIHSGADFSRLGEIVEDVLDAKLSHFGFVLEGGVDLNHDGIPEILVGAPGFSCGLGGGLSYARVYSGADFSLLFNYLDPFYPCEKLAGASLAFLPDIDTLLGPDIAVGAPDVQFGPPIGEVRIFSGQSFVPLFTLTSPDQAVEFGSSLAVVPDVNGDGLDDLAVGGPRAGFNGFNSGAVYLYSLADGTLIRRVDGARNTYFGKRLKRLHDLNGDGVDDIAVGTDSSLCHLVSGANWDSLYQFDRLPTSLTSTTDLNGDGFNELVVGNIDSVIAYSGNDLFLDAFHEEVGELNPFWLKVGGGVPLSPAILLLTQVDGRPFNLCLSGIIALDSRGAFGFPLIAPSAAGTSLGFLVYSLGTSGQVIDSAEAVVQIQ